MGRLSGSLSWSILVTALTSPSQERLYSTMDTRMEAYSRRSTLILISTFPSMKKRRLSVRVFGLASSPGPQRFLSKKRLRTSIFFTTSHRIMLCPAIDMDTSTEVSSAELHMMTCNASPNSSLEMVEISQNSIARTTGHMVVGARQLMSTVTFLPRLDGWQISQICNF